MRSTPLLALLAALALFAAACNGGTTDGTDTAESPAATDDATEEETALPEGDEQAAQRLAEAAEATAEEGSAAFILRIEADDAAVETDDAVGATESPDDATEAATEPAADATDEPTEGGTDAPTTTGGDSAQLDGALLTAEGEEDFEAQQRQMTLRSAAGETEVIVDGTTVYVEIPATEDEQWAQLELDQLVEGGIGFGGPAGMPFQTASDNLSVLRSAAAEVSEEGSETVDIAGEQVEATRYMVAIDLEQAAQEADDPDLSSALERTAQQTGADTIEMDVYVDDDDRIVRVLSMLDLGQAQEEAEDATGADADGQAQGTIRVTMDYHDFGRSVSIEIPADDAIIDVDEDEIRRMGEGGQGTGTADDTTGTTDDADDAGTDTTDTDTGTTGDDDSS